jgi:hypothetical protein
MNWFSEIHVAHIKILNLFKRGKQINIPKIF